jgi:hypothetical protein
MPTAQFMPFARRLSTAIALTLLNLGGVRVSAAESVPFRIGLAAPANTFLAIWMAHAAGVYAAQGLEVTIVPMVGGSESGPELRDGLLCTVFRYHGLRPRLEKALRALHSPRNRSLILLNNFRSPFANRVPSLCHALC